MEKNGMLQQNVPRLKKHDHYAYKIRPPKNTKKQNKTKQNKTKEKKRKEKKRKQQQQQQQQKT